MTIDRAGVWKGNARVGFGVLVALAVAFGVACGGRDAGKGGAAASPPATAASVDRAPTAGLGQQIGDLFVGALSDVTEMLREKPPAAEAKPSVRDLKERYVRQFVELGRARESLDRKGKDAVDAAIRAKLDAVTMEPWYATYGDLAQYYAAPDRELYDLIVSFNVIGQYANFDLLRQQEPDEATRLGLE